MTRRAAILLASLLATLPLAGRAALAQEGAQAMATVAPVVTFDSAWSAISRTYWDTMLVKGRWRAAHDSLRAIAVTADDDEDARRLIRALIDVPRQSHFVLIPRSAVTESDAVDEVTGGNDKPAGSPGTPGTAGLELRMIADTLVAWRVDADGPAARAGVAPGAIVTRIGALTMDSLRSLARSSTADTTQAWRLVNMIATRLIGGDAGDSLHLRFIAGTEREARFARTPLRGMATKFGNLPTMVVRTAGESVALPSRTGRPAELVSFSAWFPAIAPELDNRLFAARGAPGVILDLRGNPGGLVGMVAGVSGHFLDTAVALGTMRARGATIRFVANPRIVDRSGQRVRVIDAPLAILVDGFTGSTSEFFASGMQSLGRARVFGVSSAGQALPAVMSALPNGDVLMHVIADHEDAGGRRVEGTGVQPDEVTPLTRADLLAGRDAALEAARAWLGRAAGNDR